MKQNSYGFGLTLVVVGILVIMFNIGVLGTNFIKSFLALWPLFIIGVGCNIMFKNHSLFKGLIWLGIIITIVFFSISGIESPLYDKYEKSFFIPENIDVKDYDSTLYKKTLYNKAELQIDGLDTTVAISATDKADLLAKIPPSVRFETKEEEKDDLIQYIYKPSVHLKSSQSKYLQCQLFSEKKWTVNIDNLNVMLDMDLKTLNKVDEVNIDAFNAKIVMEYSKDISSVLNIDAFSSEVDIVIPKGTNVIVNADVMSLSTDLPEDIIRVEDSYQTEKYKKSDSALVVNLSCLASKLKISYRDE